MWEGGAVPSKNNKRKVNTKSVDAPAIDCFLNPVDCFISAVSFSNVSVLMSILNQMIKTCKTSFVHLHLSAQTLLLL